jgi:hypothetical protein
MMPLKLALDDCALLFLAPWPTALRFLRALAPRYLAACCAGCWMARMPTYFAFDWFCFGWIALRHG